MTDEEILYVKETIQELAEKLDMSVTLHLYAGDETVTVTYGCPACSANVMRSYLESNPNAKHTSQHLNDDGYSVN